MIRGHIALIRQLRAFMETSALPWADVKFKTEIGEDGRAIYDDARAEISFRHHDKAIDVYIVAPSPDQHDGVQGHPLGMLAGRCDDEVIKGPIDQSTWDAIVKLINN